MQSNDYLLTASLKSLPALKAGAFAAAISISAPVCGLRPLRAARSRTSKVPKPTKATFSPLASSFLITSNNALTVLAVYDFGNSVCAATKSINSVFEAMW